MNKTEFLKEVRHKTGTKVEDMNKIIDVMEEVIIEALQNNEEVKLFRGVVFDPNYKEAHEKVLPFWNETVSVPAKFNVRVKVSSYFKDKVNG